MLTDISLIPTIIELSQFFSANFPHVDWYPYWYLGNPYHYLIGPVVPVLLSLGKIMGIPMGFSYWFLLILSLFVASYGVYRLLLEFDSSKQSARVGSLAFLFLPGFILLLFFQNGLSHIAWSTIPFIFIFYKRFLENLLFKDTAILISLLVVVILITPSVFLTITVGLTILLITAGIQKKRYKEAVAKTFLILFIAISIATVWYTPDYWWVILTGPSFGGIPLINLLFNTSHVLLQFLPLVFAIIVVKWRHVKLTSLKKFGLYFLSVFIFLTGVRFILDPDFILDWIGFLIELQFGASIVITAFYQRISSRLTLIIFIIAILFNFYIVSNILGEQSNKIYKDDIASMLGSNIRQGKRVFLSGSSVFWINERLDIPQVRGGNDSASIHPQWAHGAYQIREGEDKNLAISWLKILGASYILAHEKGSKEYFHDFKHPENFKNLKKLSNVDLNALYKIPNTGIVRIADKSILDVKLPLNGADKMAIFSYVESLKNPISFRTPFPNKIDFDVSLEKDNVISLAIAYNSNWRISKGKGRIIADGFGNMVLLPERAAKQSFSLNYQSSFFDRVVPLGIAVVLILFLVKYRNFDQLVIQKLPKIHIGLDDKE